MEKKSSSSRRQKKPVPTIRPEMSATPASATFPIVGIGASAGGLEALDQFLGRVPTGSGMAFVIVQHLDPTRKGIMSELLQRATGTLIVAQMDRLVLHTLGLHSAPNPSSLHPRISPMPTNCAFTRTQSRIDPSPFGTGAFLTPNSSLPCMASEM